MSGPDDGHQSKARHLHGRAAVNRIGLRRLHLNACRVRYFGSRTVVAIDIKRVDRRKRAAECHCTPTGEILSVDVELTRNVRLSEFFEKPEKSVLFRHCARHRLD